MRPPLRIHIQMADSCTYCWGLTGPTRRFSLSSFEIKLAERPLCAAAGGQQDSCSSSGLYLGHILSRGCAGYCVIKHERGAVCRGGGGGEEGGGGAH